MKNLAFVNLNLIRENALTIRKNLNSGCRFCAVVKDNAYGHGAIEVASAIYNTVDCYAVSLVEEAVSLRLGGIDKDILILIPCDRLDIERAVTFGLTMSVSSLNDLAKIYSVVSNLKTKAKIHVQFNSGMNRLGISDLDELKKIFEFCKNRPLLQVEGIYSHLASPSKKRATKKQLSKFLVAINVAKGYNKNIISHISASGGTIIGLNFDMVRVGVSLYGYKPFDCNLELKKAMRVEIPVIKTFKLKPFQGALYGLKFSLFPKTLALIRYGYGDGLFRRNVKGQFSNKCMDLSLIDGKLVENGKYVINDFDIIAKKYHTISYEIMVNVAKRCEIIYER